MKKPLGILNPNSGKFQLTRRLPSPDLRFFIEHFWIVCWDLQTPYIQENLPHPTVHLVFDTRQSGIFGIVTGKFTTRLEGKGHVLGVKFRPGAFYPFIQSPVCDFNDSVLPVEKVFGAEGGILQAAVLATHDDSLRIELVEQFIRARLPQKDEQITLINQIIDCIIVDRDILKVDDLIKRMPVSKRTLQRLFSQYVGVSPKWVIKRCRQHEAVDQLAQVRAVDWSKLALDLGYFDQAHFIRDFKTVVGSTPAEYVKTLAKPL